MIFVPSDCESSVHPLPTAVGKEPREFHWSHPLSKPRLEAVPITLENRGASEQISGRAKKRPEAPQLEFWEQMSVFSESIVSKLDSCGRSDLADQIRHCHTEASYRRCSGCASVSKFYNRCDRLWCPFCQPRLARERKRAIEWWTQQAGQPKHVVLTARNTVTLTNQSVCLFKLAFKRLRRSVFAAGWRGGFFSLEVTNEGRGWHLHLHALIDARWIDAKELALRWGKLVGQEFAIVKVKDVRDGSYLQEVTKYAVKSSDLASWSGEDISCFVDAFKGVRTFGVFGSLFGVRAQFQEWIASLELKSETCECGCSHFKILTPNQLAEIELGHQGRCRPTSLKPHRVFSPQVELFKAISLSNYQARA